MRCAVFRYPVCSFSIGIKTSSNFSEHGQNWSCEASAQKCVVKRSAAVFKLYNKLFSPSIPVGLEADTLQVDLFDLLEEGRGYVVGMFLYCSSVRCNLRVSTGPFHLHHSWVFTPNCPDSCWGTQVFNRMFNSHSLWPYSLFHKETVFTTAAITSPTSVAVFMDGSDSVQQCKSCMSLQLPQSSLIGDYWLCSLKDCLTQSHMVPCQLCLEWGLEGDLTIKEIDK